MKRPVTWKLSRGKPDPAIAACRERIAAGLAEGSGPVRVLTPEECRAYQREIEARPPKRPRSLT